MQVSEGEHLPSPEIVAARYQGVLVSGSVKMVTDRLPWSEAAGTFLRNLVETGQPPILGVCYGHQLLAQCTGGLVGYNPLGRSLGTFHVNLTPDAQTDALFSCLQPKQTIYVHASHMQSVIILPPKATLLAYSSRDNHHAFRVGERAWGVQFHPEFTQGILNEHITARRQSLIKEGLDPDLLLATTFDSGDGALLLKRFAQLSRQPPSHTKL